MRQSGRAFQASKANENIVSQIDVNKVSDVAGAEILNVNLSKPFSKFALGKIIKAQLIFYQILFQVKYLNIKNLVELFLN